jgi:hypothetical protein
VSFPDADRKAREQLVLAENYIRRLQVGRQKSAFGSDDAVCLYSEGAEKSPDVLGNILVSAYAEGAEASLLVTHERIVGVGTARHKGMSGSVLSRGRAGRTLSRILRGEYHKSAVGLGPEFSAIWAQKKPASHIETRACRSIDFNACSCRRCFR